MSKFFNPINQILNSNDIVDCNQKGNIHLVDNLVTYINGIFQDSLATKLILYLTQKGVSFPENTSPNEFAEDGVECKILKTNGTGWQNAKIRFRVVMEIDIQDSKTETVKIEASPLDDIRQSIQEQTEN